MPSADVKGVVKRVSFANLPKGEDEENGLSNGNMETIDLSSDTQPTVASLMNRTLTAIAKRTKGQATEYYAIVDLLGKGSKTSEDLQMWISAVSLCVSHLSSSCQSLVNELLKVSWLDQSDGFVSVYAHFLEVFVSAQSIHAVAVCEMLVKSFRFGGLNSVMLSERI